MSTTTTPQNKRLQNASSLIKKHTISEIQREDKGSQTDTIQESSSASLLKKKTTKVALMNKRKTKTGS